MYCNINEAFGGNSNYIKNYLDNELNNEKLLEKYKNFDSFFSMEEKEQQQQRPNNINEHFENVPTKISNANKINKEPICDKSLEHIIKCSDCKKKLIKIYIYDTLNNFNIQDKMIKNVLSIILILLLIIIYFKLIWKL
jgi:hypothetical protein